MKKNIIILLSLLLLILIVLTFNKYRFDNKREKDLFTYHSVSNIKKLIETDDTISDKEKYGDRIVTEDLLSINYSFFDKEKSISGKIYIDNDKYLYITDINDNINYKVSNVKFKTMFKKDYKYDAILIYLISEDLRLYSFELDNNNIKNSFVTKVNINYNAINFVNVDFKSDIYDSSSTLFILDDSGNIFDVTSGLKYNDKISVIYNKYFIYEDNTISNVYGNLLKDSKGKDYKVKYFFVVDKKIISNNFNTGIIITEDNKLIYLDDANKKIYEYQGKIKGVSFKGEYPYIASKLIITFVDNSTLTYNALCGDYYCLNDL